MAAETSRELLRVLQRIANALETLAAIEFLKTGENEQGITDADEALRAHDWLGAADDEDDA